ncbi:uncharacterized protein B0T15DRAFT_252645 [Chaetomium strumarium]|uniref:Uncharacterized protein n=1 Tax=Chaetomium strumarium TaxID=1170767 RepID=A0AAJ0GRH6_9PEZI|nr:hypothetical protein B0T15DRAFT_252645 [Chaetomium strumarium]
MVPAQKPRNLLSWERGGLPMLAAEESTERRHSLIRLTVDVDGLKSIERLKERPPFSRERFDDRSFVIEEEVSFGATLAHFKGLCQLFILEDMKEPGFSVWDTSTPPTLTRWLRQPPGDWYGQRFYTIDLGTATGLTFVEYDGLVAIYAHSRTHPGCDKRYDRDGADWIYMPLPPHDTILRCGPLVTRDSLRIEKGMSAFMFWTRLSGEIVIGRNNYNFDPERCASLLGPPDRPVTTLVYRKRFLGPKTSITAVAT